MFVRKKKNKSGLVSIQIIEKRDGKSVLVKTIGSSTSEKIVQELYEQGKQFVLGFGGQQVLQFVNEQQIVDTYFRALQSFRLVGPELLLGKIFDEIGFGSVKDVSFVNWLSHA